MHTLLLFLHFIGMALGIGLPVANMVSQRLAHSASPEAAAALRRIPPMLAPFSAGGLITLWVTGVLLLFGYWGVSAVPGMFWVKLVCVIALTAIVVTIWMTMARIRAGDVSVASRMPMLGMGASLFGLLAVLFATMAFH